MKAVQSQSPPRYERRLAPTSFAPFEARVRALLEGEPELPAVVLADGVGWTGSTHQKQSGRKPGTIHLTLPAVSPPISRFSMSMNRITTGRIATIDTPKT